MGYLGRRPPYATIEEAVAARPRVMTGFEGVPEERWRREVEHFVVVREDGLDIPYDPRLREAVEAAGAQPVPDLWPLFEALPRPLAALRGANSDLLDAETFGEMRRRRPDMIAAEVPGRGHVPFLDEPQSLEVIRTWMSRL
jgi:pimeloyl-ACP methyl ester carboxylesterase